MAGSFVKQTLTFFGIALLVSSCSTTDQTSTRLSTGSSRWIVLFDGKSTEAWRGITHETFPTNNWKIEDGSLATIPGPMADIMTKEQFDNFELQLDWKISPGGNSGIMYHTTDENEQPGTVGPEMQVLDDSKHPDGKNPTTTAGALYGLIAPKNKILKPVGEWNHVWLVVNHNHVEHWLNGVKVVEYELNSPELTTLIARSKFAAFPRFAKEPTGHISLQHHLDAAWYRNIKVRRL